MSWKQTYGATALGYLMKLNRSRDMTKKGNPDTSELMSTNLGKFKRDWDQLMRNVAMNS